MTTMQRKAPSNVFGADSLPPPIRQSWRSPVRRHSAFVGPDLLKADIRPKVRGSLQELSRSDAPQFLDRNSSGQHRSSSAPARATSARAHLHRLRQIVAEELSVSFEAITTVVHGRHRSARRMAAAPSISSAAECPTSARPPRTPIRLCSISRQNSLGVAKDQLSVKDGIVSGGGKSISYGDLVKGPAVEAHDPRQRQTSPASWDSPSKAIRR